MNARLTEGERIAKTVRDATNLQAVLRNQLIAYSRNHGINPWSAILAVEGILVETLVTMPAEQRDTLLDTIDIKGKVLRMLADPEFQRRTAEYEALLQARAKR